eukprot:1152891-Pelagomonas_calceolata.AAC.1
MENLACSRSNTTPVSDDLKAICVPVRSLACTTDNTHESAFVWNSLLFMCSLLRDVKVSHCCFCQQGHGAKNGIFGRS